VREAAALSTNCLLATETYDVPNLDSRLPSETMLDTFQLWQRTALLADVVCDVQLPGQVHLSCRPTLEGPSAACPSRSLLENSRMESTRRSSFDIQFGPGLQIEPYHAVQWVYSCHLQTSSPELASSA
jgi:hypothetical protein